jgi:hypothetical protein
MPNKVDLRHTKKSIKTLKEFDRILGAVSEDTRGQIVKLWNKGFGANGFQMKSLTPKYAAKKGKSGRVPIRNLNFKGLLQQSMSVRKDKTLRWVIGWQDIEQLKIARGNNTYAPNMMSVGPVLQVRAQTKANKLFWKSVNRG